jgi:hypothetical protein
MTQRFLLDMQQSDGFPSDRIGHDEIASAVPVDADAEREEFN